MSKEKFSIAYYPRGKGGIRCVLYGPFYSIKSAKRAFKDSGFKTGPYHFIEPDKSVD